MKLLATVAALFSLPLSARSGSITPKRVLLAAKTASRI